MLEFLGQCCFCEWISFVIDFNGDFGMGCDPNARKRC